MVPRHFALILILHYPSRVNVIISLSKKASSSGKYAYLFNRHDRNCSPSLVDRKATLGLVDKAQTFLSTLYFCMILTTKVLDGFFVGCIGSCMSGYKT